MRSFRTALRLIIFAGLSYTIGIHSVTAIRHLECLLLAMARSPDKPNLTFAHHLLRMGVSPNVHYLQRHAASTAALIEAAQTGHTALVDLLVRHGGHVDLRSPWDGRTSLMAAALNGHTSTLACLLAYGANVNAANGGGFTALMWAAGAGHAEAVKILLHHGARTDLKNYSGDTAEDIVLQKLFDHRYKAYRAIRTILNKKRYS